MTHPDDASSTRGDIILGAMTDLRAPTPLQAMDRRAVGEGPPPISSYGMIGDMRTSGEHPEIHRQLRCTRGRVPMQMVFMPRFEYGARTTRLEVLRAGIFATDRTDQVLTLSSAKPFDWTVEASTATARFELEK